LDRADSARSISQSAQSSEDWKLVISRWQQAIQLLRQIPKQDPNRRYVTTKLAEFQRGLTMAQRRVSSSKLKGPLEPAISVQPRLSSDGEPPTPAMGTRAFQAPIKYRRDRIPVIDVRFNGGYTFEMMVDTGASGTMITPAMASRLQFQPAGSASIMTPAGPSSTTYGFINSIQVGGHSVYNVPVTLGPVALLGHDFFGECELAFRRNVVEFANCSN
jgi:predicted aspartyl protease